MSNLGYATALYVLALFGCKQPDLPPRILEVRGNALFFPRDTTGVMQSDELQVAMDEVGTLPDGCRLLLDYGITPPFISSSEGARGYLEIRGEVAWKDMTPADRKMIVLGVPTPERRVICGEREAEKRP